MESKKVKDMFDVRNIMYGTILYNPVTMKVGIFRKQRIKNKGIITPPGKPIPYMWVDVVNLIEDDSWAELWANRDDQIPITDFTNWVHPDVNTIRSDDPVADHIYELGKYYGVMDMLENPNHWYINMVDDEVEELYLERPRDIWDNIKSIMGK